MSLQRESFFFFFTNYFFHFYRKKENYRRNSRMNPFKTNKVVMTGWPNTSCHLSCQVLQPRHFSRPRSLSWTSQGHSQVDVSQKVAALKKLGFSHNSLEDNLVPDRVPALKFPPYPITFFTLTTDLKTISPPSRKILDTPLAFIKAVCWGR